MPDTGPIGEYLRARRQLVTPADVGLPAGARRRVAGLRREEVALLAGISIDYYIRLEQGRDRNPSAQVLDALSRTLQLDADAAAYLRGLATEATPSRGPAQPPERVSPGVLQLIESWSMTPAFVQGRYLDVLAANPLATALVPYYRTGKNLLRVAFLEEEHRDSFPDWELSTQGLVSALRARIGPEVDDPTLNELVGELSVRSERFAQLWARHDARVKRSGEATIPHRTFGALELSFEKLPLPDTAGQTLVVFHAAPGSEAAQRLALLSAMVGGQ